MNNNLKYYIYSSEEQLGPFTSRRIIDELQDERLGKDVFLWKEGMIDWKPIGEVEEFQEYVVYLPLKSRISEDLRHFKNTITDVEAPPTRPPIYFKGLDGFGEDRSVQWQNESALDKPSEILSANSLEAPVVISAQIHMQKIKQIFLITTVVLVLAAAAYAFSPNQKHEVILARMDAKLPDIVLMRNILNGRSSEWNRVQVLKERGDDVDPSLFVGADFPDHSQLVISLTGIKASLVGALEQNGVVETTIKDRLARTLPIKKAGGGSLASGLYKVTVDCLTCVEPGTRGLKIVSPIAVGMTDLKNYQQKLTAFHALVRKQAESELMEVDQILEILEEGISPRGKANPSEMQMQLKEILLSLTEDVAKSSYFYSLIYLRLKTLYFSIEQNAPGASIELENLRSTVKRNKSALATNHGYPEVLE